METAIGGLTLTGGWVSIMPRSSLHLAGFDRGRLWAGAVGEPLEANAILLESKCGRVVFLQIDVLSAGDHLRRHVLDQLRGKLQDEELFLVASHTHYAPGIDQRLSEMGEIDDGYVGEVMAKVAVLLERVLSTTPRPAFLEYGRRRAYHAVNRRRWCLRPALRFPPVKRVMALHPNPDGPKDETVRVFLAKHDPDGATPAGVVWNYACHAVTTNPARVISADYPGGVRRAVRARLGADVPVVFLPGFAGNVRPNRIDSAPLSPYYLLHRIVNGPVFGKFNERSQNRWISSLANVVLDTLSREMDRVEISGINCCRHLVPIRKLMEGNVDDRSLSLHLVNLGRAFSILGVSAEPVIEYALALQRLFPQQTLVPVGYTDAVCAYLPTSEMLDEGGLEVDSPGYVLDHATYRRNVSQLIVESVSQLRAASPEAAAVATDDSPCPPAGCP